MCGTSIARIVTGVHYQESKQAGTSKNLLVFLAKSFWWEVYQRFPPPNIHAIRYVRLSLRLFVTAQQLKSVVPKQNIDKDSDCVVISEWLVIA